MFRFFYPTWQLGFDHLDQDFEFEFELGNQPTVFPREI